MRIISSGESLTHIVQEVKTMIEDEFKLIHNEGKLLAVVTVEGKTYEMDVTDYFDKENPHDDWLDYRLELGKR
jgi:hypothetical protein